jgi:cell division protein FtsL
MTDVLLLLASLAVVALGAVLVMFQRRMSVVRQRRELAAHERWMTSDEYITLINAAETDEDLRRAQEGNGQE